MLDRATSWAKAEPAVGAAVVFGSVARGTDNEFSDLDLIVVAETGCREDLWARRTQIAGVIMGADPVHVSDPSWQAAYRYQAWREDGTELDLTLAEEDVDVFGGLAKGFVVILDRAGVADRLTATVARWKPPEFDPAEHVGVWPWLLYLHGKLCHGEWFAVRAGVMDTLAAHVVPALGSAYHSADSELPGEVMRRMHQTSPRSSEPGELDRSLRETAGAYAWALSRWAERTGNARPEHPLERVTLARLGSATSG